MSRTILQQENLISNPYDIANIFSNYFSSVADTAKKHIKYSQKHFLDDLIIRAIEEIYNIFIHPTDSEDIANIISSVNMNKPSGPKSIPYKILNLRPY